MRTITSTLIRIFFAVIISILPNIVTGESTYAYLHNDTLTLGNRLIERKMLWNNGNLYTISVTDKSTSHTWQNNAEQPDLYVCNIEQSSHATFHEKIVQENFLHPLYREVTVEYRLGDIQIKKVFRLYEDCPAIACDIFFKGDGSFFFKGELPINPADLKNIESVEDMTIEMEHPVLDQIKPGGKHWEMKAVEFFDVTDLCNNMIAERSFLPFRKSFFRGNLLFAHNKEVDGGLFFLKEAPCSTVQLAYRGADFCIEFDHFSVIGCGLEGDDINPNSWTRAYGCVLGIYSGGEHERLLALRNYQKKIRASHFDEMIMMNTWGDRGQDKNINEKFCIGELEAASRLGITHFQIDDGWQYGKSPNSAVTVGSFKNIWQDNNYWNPDPTKFPNGLQVVSKKAKELNITLGLWFNPSIQDDYADWEKDAAVLIKFYNDYGIRVFKIDGLQIPNKNAEANLRKLFDRVKSHTGDSVIFNLDVTAGHRGGYNMFNEYGNIFLENRYTDWGIYYPYWTLRNLWQLSKYIPAERLQVNFLNKWRNRDVYGEDIYAPYNYSFEYLFATTMAGQPLAWFEGSGLPSEAFEISSIIEKYRLVQHDLHSGTILPIGDEPSGNSWTGFQSENGNKGYFIIYRENNDDTMTQINTWLPEGSNVKFTKLLGKGSITTQRVGKEGSIEVVIPDKNSYLMCSYELAE